jgi:hypothetical protein
MLLLSSKHRMMCGSSSWVAVGAVGAAGFAFFVGFFAGFTAFFVGFVGGFGAFDNIEDKGTNGKSRQVWASANYVTVTGSATTAGLVGFIMIHYERTASES